MTGTENTIEQIRLINERHQKLHASSAKIAAIDVPTVTVPPRLFDSINSARTLARQFAAIDAQTIAVPTALFESVNSAKVLAKQFAAINTQTVTVPTALFESVNSAKVLAKQFAAINTQTVTVPPALFESVNSAKVLAKQFVAIRTPSVTVSPKIFESVNVVKVLPKHFVTTKAPTFKVTGKFSGFPKSTKRPSQRAIVNRENRTEPFSYRGIEFVPKDALTRPTVRKLSPAKDVVTRIYEEFDRRRSLEADRRHEVVIIVTLLSGKKLLVESITTDGDHLVRIVGNGKGEQSVEVVSGIASLQYEIRTFERTPCRPNLTIGN
jgi:hypothetical protein